MHDRRGKDRGRRCVAILRCARLKNCRHCSGLRLFRRLYTAETTPVQRYTAARARATQNRPRELRQQAVRAKAVCNEFPFGALNDPWVLDLSGLALSALAEQAIRLSPFDPAV